MRGIEIELKDVRPIKCSASVKNCIGCPYNMWIGLLLGSREPIVICRHDEEEEEEEK